ncbi:hypothetical protein BC937DRAFT_94325 [Endogone sp. FLAS-F59071]|nr:hypothetical protein BC937DRAFT_94325 [Endogone sp. FLAS-F59071]|eukprot:RUS14119.1 hypothetical protein BC937DRAFT_94325 [Endogone sp. FLAS-F59071]
MDEITTRGWMPSEATLNSESDHGQFDLPVVSLVLKYLCSESGENRIDTWSLNVQISKERKKERKKRRNEICDIHTKPKAQTAEMLHITEITSCICTK